MDHSFLFCPFRFLPALALLVCSCVRPPGADGQQPADLIEATSQRQGANLKCALIIPGLAA